MAGKGKPFVKGDPRRHSTGRGKGVISIPDVLRRIGKRRLPKKMRDALTAARAIPESDLKRDLTKLEALMEAVYWCALRGESWAVQFIADRTEGKVKDVLEMQGGQTLEIVEEIVDAS